MCCTSHSHSNDSATSGLSGTALNNMLQRNYKSLCRPQICVHSFFICMKLGNREGVRPHTESSRLLKGIRIHLLLEVLTECFNYVINGCTKPDVV